MDRVGVGVDLIIKPVVVLEGDIDDDVRTGLFAFGRRDCAGKGEGLGLDDSFAPIEEGDIFFDPVFKEEHFLPLDAFV